jgi:hypothetical protein
MGLQGKTGIGTQVFSLWREQRFDDIRDYCLGDVRLEYNLLSSADPRGCCSYPTVEPVRRWINRLEWIQFQLTGDSTISNFYAAEDQPTNDAQ